MQGACQAGGQAVQEAIGAAKDPELRRRFENSPMEADFDPSVPHRLTVGDRVQLSLLARFQSGEVCRFCQASWTTRKSAIASVSPADACTEGHCSAVLWGLRPAKTLVEVAVCQSYEARCREWKFPVRVEE
jgi:hypothetical protein